MNYSKKKLYSVKLKKIWTKLSDSDRSIFNGKKGKLSSLKKSLTNEEYKFLLKVKSTSRYRGNRAFSRFSPVDRKREIKHVEKKYYKKLLKKHPTAIRKINNYYMKSSNNHLSAEFFKKILNIVLDEIKTEQIKDPVNLKNPRLVHFSYREARGDFHLMSNPVKYEEYIFSKEKTKVSMLNLHHCLTKSYLGYTKAYEFLYNVITSRSFLYGKTQKLLTPFTNEIEKIERVITTQADKGSPIANLIILNSANVTTTLTSTIFINYYKKKLNSGNDIFCQHYFQHYDIELITGQKEYYAINKYYTEESHKKFFRILNKKLAEGKYYAVSAFLSLYMSQWIVFAKHVKNKKHWENEIPKFKDTENINKYYPDYNKLIKDSGSNKIIHKEIQRSLKKYMQLINTRGAKGRFSIRNILEDYRKPYLNEKQRYWIINNYIETIRALSNFSARFYLHRSTRKLRKKK